MTTLLVVVLIIQDNGTAPIPVPVFSTHTENIHSAASRARDCGNPANLVALAQIRVDRAPDGTRSSRSWRRLRD